MKTKNTKADNGYVLGSDAARAVGRFNPNGPLGYIAKSAPNAVIRATREEAVEDERLHRECAGSLSVEA